MSLLVTGSIGIDTVNTPHGQSVDCIGGSSVYFAMAASLFTPVRFVGVIGNDCPFDLNDLFAKKDVDLTGLETRTNSKTFRWAATYNESMNDRNTDNVELNVLAEAPPKVPDKFTDSKYIFLANTHPALQLELLIQIANPVFVAADTMNMWIENDLDDLKKLLKKINCLFINDSEAKMLTNESNLVTAAKKILNLGPDMAIVKKGEFGSMLIDKSGSQFHLPAYPSMNVIDPTGAGDSFAGAALGYIAAQNKFDFDTVKKAIAFGTVAASYTIEDFSINKINLITPDDIEDRFETLRKLTNF